MKNPHALALHTGPGGQGLVVRSGVQNRIRMSVRKPIFHVQRHRHHTNIPPRSVTNRSLSCAGTEWSPSNRAFHPFRPLSASLLPRFSPRFSSGRRAQRGRRASCTASSSGPCRSAAGRGAARNRLRISQVRGSLQALWGYTPSAVSFEGSPSVRAERRLAAVGFGRRRHPCAAERTKNSPEALRIFSLLLPNPCFATVRPFGHLSRSWKKLSFMVRCAHSLAPIHRDGRHLYLQSPAVLAWVVCVGKAEAGGQGGSKAEVSRWDILPASSLCPSRLGAGRKDTMRDAQLRGSSVAAKSSKRGLALRRLACAAGHQTLSQNCPPLAAPSCPCGVPRTVLPFPRRKPLFPAGCGGECCARLLGGRRHARLSAANGGGHVDPRHRAARGREGQGRLCRCWRGERAQQGCRRGR